MALIFLLNLTCTHLYFFDIFHSVPFQPTLMPLGLKVDIDILDKNACLASTDPDSIAFYLTLKTKALTVTN